jgi:hypothetical protein
MNVLQCPRCTIKLRHPSELRDHLASDHPSFEARAASAEDDLLGACHCHHHESPAAGRWLHRSDRAKNAA